MQGSPTRVALLCGGYQPELDGVSDYVRRLALALAPTLETSVVCSSSGEWRFAEVASTAKALRRMRPDVVHVQYAPVAFRWRRAVRLLPDLLQGTPLVVTAHEFEPNVLRLFRHADAVLTTTLELAQRLRDADACLEPRVVPIGPNVACASGDRLALARAARQRWQVPADAPLVVFFGFLHPVKGLEYLVRALAMLRERFPRAHLLLAGGVRSLALPGAEGDAYRGGSPRSLPNLVWTTACGSPATCLTRTSRQCCWRPTSWRCRSRTAPASKAAACWPRCAMPARWSPRSPTSPTRDCARANRRCSCGRATPRRRALRLGRDRRGARAALRRAQRSASRCDCA